MMLVKYDIRVAVAAAVMLWPMAVGALVIEVSNPLDFARDCEIVEVDAGLLPASPFVIRGVDGKEVPWQKTHDGKVVFPADVAAKGVSRYTLSEGIPSVVDTVTYGRIFPERLDDMSWENDWAAYRAYGPALQRTGERGYGYDVWTKSTSRPVLEKRYYDHMHRNLSFHADHGEGMDVYEVGQTLGGGTAALLDSEGRIVWPWCYERYEILDNGPLRFSVRLDYDGNPTRETRVISLDAGSPLNHVVVCWPDAQTGASAVFGFPLHRPVDADGAYTVGSYETQGIIAYADPTQGPVAENGEIFLGALTLDPDAVSVTSLFTEPKGNAVGQLLEKVPVGEGKAISYWFGSSWSKGKTPTFEEWTKLLERKLRMLRTPLVVKIKK